MGLDIPFVAYGITRSRPLSLGNEAPTIVGVHGVGGEANSIVDLATPATVMLGHHVIGEHPSRLTDVELRRPAAGFGEFVTTEAPPRISFSDLIWHRGIIGQEPV